MSELDFVLWVDRETGQVWRQEYRDNEDLHRPEEEGPAIIERYRGSSLSYS